MKLKLGKLIGFCAILCIFSITLSSATKEKYSISSVNSLINSSIFTTLGDPPW